MGAPGGTGSPGAEQQAAPTVGSSGSPPHTGGGAEATIAALRDEVARLRQVIDASSDMQALYDDEGRYVEVSAAAERLFGWSPAELIGTSSYDYFHPDDLERIRAAHDQVLAEPTPAKVVYRLRCKSGEYRWVEVTGASVIERGERVGYIHCATRDVHEQYTVERALRESQERIRLATEHSAIGMAVVAPDGSFLEVNEALCRILGRSRAELSRLTFQDVTHPDDLDADLDFVARLDAGELETYEMEKRYLRADGSVVDAQLNGSVVRDADGKRAYYIAQVQDVSDRIRARQAEAASARAHRTEVLGRLAGGVAHHLNNQLSIISMQVDLARMSRDLDPTVDLRLAGILDAVTRAGAFARELLMFAGQATRSVSDFDVRDAVAAAHRLIAHSCDPSIDVANDIDVEPCEVRADRREVESVLLALMLNAADAVADGHGRQIRVSVAGCDAADGPERLDPEVRRWIRLRVSDDGRGMTRQELEQCTEPFFSTRTDRSGMGLAVVDSVARTLGGVLDLRSHLGEGTVADLWIPALVQDPPSPTASCRVLVVDDEPDVLALVSLVLERSGYDVQRAGGGGAAVESLDAVTEPFDVLVTDMVMPGSSGGEVVARFREANPSGAVVVMTGYAGTSGGGDLPDDVAVIGKPFAVAELLAAIEAARATAGRSPISD